MSPILNREFQHPADGWYMIEPKGEHPNAAAQVVQVIDDQAAQAMVNGFNRQADTPHFPGLLVDHEHFSHNAEKETRAFGWLTRLQDRPDGIYGQIRWTETGRAAVDGGDYRFFSTEYDLRDAVALNAKAESEKLKAEIPNRIRPLKLSGLTLTNKPNNKGGKPITNRADPLVVQPSGCTGDVTPSPQAKACTTNNQAGAAASRRPPLDTQLPFAVPAGAGAARTNRNNKNNMTTIATKLGLAAEASEEAILAEVTKILNRATEAENKLAPLQHRLTELEAEQLHNRQAQADADLAPLKDKLSEPERAALRAQLIANRDATLPLLRLASQSEISNSKSQIGDKSAGPVINRATAKTPPDRNLERTVLLNHEVDSYRNAHHCTFERAWNAVKNSKPELFVTEEK